MILIADSGSTKTDWRIIDNPDRVFQVFTEGLNPHYQAQDEIIALLRKSVMENKLPKTVKKIFYYGAGCSSNEKNGVIKDALNKVFEVDQINVDSDMLGVARAVCGRRQGIVGILGTGSGSCIYDGEKIVRQVPSLGYILGDEGSGAHIGKLLLADFLRGALPDNIMRKFNKHFDADKEEILHRINKGPFPSRYLASFTKFVHQHLYDGHIQKLVRASFGEFIEQYIFPYHANKHIPVRFCGAIAFYFEDILRLALNEHGLVAGHIVEAPGNGLSLFHLEEL